MDFQNYIDVARIAVDFVGELIFLAELLYRIRNTSQRG
jgi:hypothetical protein